MSNFEIKKISGNANKKIELICRMEEYNHIYSMKKLTEQEFINLLSDMMKFYEKHL